MLTGEIIEEKQATVVFPASHYVASHERTVAALSTIEAELEERLDHFRKAGRVLEAQRLEQRTRYDLEMIKEIGYCQGIENYSRHFDGREKGIAPYTLMDYFPNDYLMVVDESHQTIPQLRAMLHGDRSRKDNLVKFGFRLPSAYDNRPLKFEEWEERMNQVIYTSATPSAYEMENASQVVELIVRPTGLMDPPVEVRPTLGQIDDLVEEIKKRVEDSQRVLVTTLTIRMSEDLTDYLLELGIRAQYMHSQIDTLERHEILRSLRLGEFDVLVGINLLREGLDLPEVALVAILDADKQGFLRSETSLIQIMGRAARHVEGRVIMYADGITAAMQAAIDESERRRKKQRAYNEEHGITPQSVVKAIRDTIRSKELVEEGAEELVPKELAESASPDDLVEIISALEAEMAQAAADLEFERAAQLRDEIHELKALVEAR